MRFQCALRTSSLFRSLSLSLFSSLLSEHKQGVLVCVCLEKQFPFLRHAVDCASVRCKSLPGQSINKARNIGVLSEIWQRLTHSLQSLSLTRYLVASVSLHSLANFSSVVVTAAAAAAFSLVSAHSILKTLIHLTSNNTHQIQE